MNLTELELEVVGRAVLVVTGSEVASLCRNVAHEHGQTAVPHEPGNGEDVHAVAPAGDGKATAEGVQQRRGNAGAFGAVVAAFTDGIIMAFIAALFGKPNFDSIGLDIGDGRLAIGSFLTAVVNLVIVAAAVFFFIVKPVQAIKDRQKKEGEVVPDADDIALLKEIRDLLKNRP